MSLKEKIMHFAQLHDLDSIPRYSGRGMFGKTCLALVIPPGLLATAKKELDPHWDSLGLEVVIYWPGVSGGCD